MVGDEVDLLDLTGLGIDGEVFNQRPAEEPLGLVDRLKDRSDRVAVRLGRGDGYELAPVVDDIARSSGAAADGLQLEGVHLPDLASAAGIISSNL